MVIVVADDEASVRNTLFELFKDRHEILLCADGHAALKEIETTSVDVVITDFQMPKTSGIDLIRKGKEMSPSTSFLLMTAFGTVEQAVEAIRLGAEDYFLKPFDIDEIEHRVKRIEDLRSLSAQRQLRAQTQPANGRLLGKSKAMDMAREFIAKAAQVPSPVLILGPSGAGKEVVAQEIHDAGPRANQPFIAVNCASLSEQLMESELFGHEKGAFTGANAAKPGKFELAANGTLFLDELGEMSPALQAKLLRAIQEKEFYRVGGVRRIRSQARLVAATNRPLRKMVEEGTFREDLFFRLNVLSFELPPLSQRLADIPIFVDHFWEKLTKQFGRKVALSKEARTCLIQYQYPGNVRELQNMIERLVVMGPESGELGAELLPHELRAGAGKGARAGTDPAAILGTKSFEALVEEFELGLIRGALSATKNNHAKAAELLKLNRGTLLYKLKRLGLMGSARDKDPESEAA